MSEYIIEWSGFGGQLARLLNGNVPLVLWPKKIREERRREEIVRCRDCEHMIHFWHHDDERWQCANEMLDGLDVSPSFYCAWGERKERGE